MTAERDDTMVELRVEKLKANEKTFSLLCDAEQTMLAEVGLENCEVYTEKGWKRPSTDDFEGWLTYRIRSDYNPHGDYEIKKVSGRLQVQYKGQYYMIYILPSMPGFRGFYSGGNIRFEIDRVAELMKDRKMYVRFEKEESQ